MAAALVVAALDLAGADETAGEIGARLVALALLALVTAVVLGWVALVPAALVLLGAAYAVRLTLGEDALDARAPLVAAGLLLTAELAYWAVEEREQVRVDPGGATRRAGVVGLFALAALTVGAGLLTLVDLEHAEGLAVDLVGAAAAAGALFVLVLLARRGRAAGG